MSKTRLLAITTILSVIGLAAGLLSYKTYTAIGSSSESYCTIGGGCQVLYSAPEASILGIHFSILAPVYFLAVTILSAATLYTGSTSLLHLLTGAYILGIILVPYLVYIEYKYREICIYCTIMHITIIAGTILSSITLRLRES